MEPLKLLFPHWQYSVFPVFSDLQIIQMFLSECVFLVVGLLQKFWVLLHESLRPWWIIEMQSINWLVRSIFTLVFLKVRLRAQVQVLRNLRSIQEPKLESCSFHMGHRKNILGSPFGAFFGFGLSISTLHFHHISGCWFLIPMHSLSVHWCGSLRVKLFRLLLKDNWLTL